LWPNKLLLLYYKIIIIINRLRTHAEIKRATAVSAIRAVHALSTRALSDIDIVPEFLVATTDLDSLWAQFKSEDDSILDYLVSLDKINEYSPDMPTEVRGLINVSKSMAVKLKPKRVEVNDMPCINKGTASLGDGEHSLSPSTEKNTQGPLSRLPGIGPNLTVIFVIGRLFATYSWR
jgi:hypothetical protein